MASALTLGIRVHQVRAELPGYGPALAQTRMLGNLQMSSSCCRSRFDHQCVRAAVTALAHPSPTHQIYSLFLHVLDTE